MSEVELTYNRERALEHMLFDMCDMLKCALKDMAPYCDACINQTDANCGERCVWKRKSEAESLIRLVEGELYPLDRKYVINQFYKIIKRDRHDENNDEISDYISIGCADAIEFADENGINTDDPALCMLAACIAAHTYLLDDTDNQESQDRLEFVSQLADFYESVLTERSDAE